MAQKEGLGKMAVGDSEGHQTASGCKQRTYRSCETLKEIEHSKTYLRRGGHAPGFQVRGESTERHRERFDVKK